MDKSPKLISNIAPFGLRMQPALREELQLAAKQNARSLNQEIIARLEASLNPSTEPVGAAEEATTQSQADLIAKKVTESLIGNEDFLKALKKQLG